jgi:hypothetical protein
MKRTIEVTVSPNGDISIDAIGFKGADCDQATKYLEEALGAVAQKQRKPEFHQHNRKTVHQRIVQ